MPKFRTKKSDRATYIYKDAYGNEACALKAGENGITEVMINELHTMDDDIHNATKRDSYRKLISYDNTLENEDKSADPETILLEAIDKEELHTAFKTVWLELTAAQREFIIKKQQGYTNVNIAKEENVTEAAIRKRLSKIQKKFKKFLK